MWYEVPMEEQIQFNRQKFKDVVHIIVHYAASAFGPDALGNTKLHKVLYFSDMLRYLASGAPLTGAEYQRQRFGPTARHLTSCLKELENEQRVRTSRVNYYGYQKAEYQPIAPPDLHSLSETELALIKDMAQFVCARSAVEISEFSHDDVWSSVPMGERIPYYAAFAMFPSELTDDDMEEAAAESLEIAPQIEVERERHFF
jgi:hypothetical protein